MHNKAYHIFTHKDLDGAVSLLTFIWSKPDSYISYNEISNLEVYKIKEYINRTINPPNVIILDIPIRDEFLPELDRSFITIIDHHERSLPLADKFKNSKIICKEFSSNSLFLRKIFQEKQLELNNDQKKLILYADDYDCFNLKYTESYDLNIIFWYQFKNNFNKFIDYYKNGFIPFTKQQQTLINDVKLKIKNNAENLKCFSFELNLENKNRSILATMSDNNDTLVGDYLINKYNPDLFIFINTKKEKVTLKQNKKQDTFFDLNAFAEKYCDGSGNKFSAVGSITPMFMELTKNFKPL